MSATPEKMIALYSAKADAQFGHTIYERENGERVACTCIVLPDTPEDFYQWPDKENLGEVVRFVGESLLHREQRERLIRVVR